MCIESIPRRTLDRKCLHRILPPEPRFIALCDRACIIPPLRDDIWNLSDVPSWILCRLSPRDQHLQVRYLQQGPENLSAVRRKPPPPPPLTPATAGGTTPPTCKTRLTARGGR